MKTKDECIAWYPGAAGYTHDETIVAIGLQCGQRQFPVADVVEWLGKPDLVAGDASSGHIVYFYARDADRAPMFDVRNGKVVEFAVVSRNGTNAMSSDGATHFNILDQMRPFDAASFL